MKKLSLLIIIIGSLVQSSFSQCNVKEYNVKEFHSIETDYEVVYSKISGNKKIQGAFIKVMAVSEKEDIKSPTVFFISIKSASSTVIDLLIPDGLYIQFEDNSHLNLDATIITDLYELPKIVSREGTFLIDTSDFMKLQSKKIKFINIIDSRTQSVFKCNPFGSILLNQSNCIGSRI